MRHRHLDLAPDIPVEHLPGPALVDLLERGDLDDWHPLLRAVRQDPTGDLARRLGYLVDAFPMYGTAPLWRGWLERRRAVATDRMVPEVSGLATLRRSHGLTQAQVAERLGISQSDVSKIERRTDMKISTLRAYLAALDGAAAGGRGVASP